MDGRSSRGIVPMDALLSAPLGSFRSYIDGQRPGAMMMGRGEPPRGLGAVPPGAAPRPASSDGGEPPLGTYEELLRLDENNVEVGMADDALRALRRRCETTWRGAGGPATPGGGAGGDADTCHICMEAYAPGDGVIRLPKCGASPSHLEIGSRPNARWGFWGS